MVNPYVSVLARRAVCGRTVSEALWLEETVGATRRLSMDEIRAKNGGEARMRMMVAYMRVMERCSDSETEETVHSSQVC